MKVGYKKTEIGIIPDDWGIKKIGDLVKIDTGFPFKSQYYSLDNGIRVIRGENLGQRTFKWNIAKYWNRDTSDLQKYFVKENQVVVAMDGSVGKNKSIVKKKDLPLLLAQRVARLEAREFIDQDYLNQIILSPLFEKYCNSIKTGTTISHISQNQISDFLIPYPPLPEQKAIAKVLSDLDDKIELNNEMNKALEEIGQALFKRWFIDFEFPDENGNPYRSSGREMVYSEELGKEIPKDWEFGKLGDFISLQKGLSYKGNGLCNREEGLPMINLGTMAPHSGFIYGGLKYYKGEYKERNLVFPGDIVIANTDITQKREVLGSPALVPYDLGHDKILFTHHIFAVRNKSSLPNIFIYYVLQTNKYKERSSTYATGTTVLALPQDAVLDLFLCIPQSTILDLFVKHVLSIKSKISSNIEENRHLSEIRDSLLPKLMSGEIRVPLEASQ